MTELSKKTFDEQIDEVIGFVNEKHENEKRLEEAGNKGINAKMKKVLNRIMGIPETPKKIIYFSNENNEKLHIRTSDGAFVGTIILNNGIKRKIELVNNKPIFKIYKNGDELFKKDVLTGTAKTNDIKPDQLKEVFKAHSDAMPMIEASKQIFELIENKEYSRVDAYILYSMERLVNNDLQAAPLEQKEIYSKVKFNMQKIKILIDEIKEYNEKGVDYTSLVEKVDNEYREACQTLVNAGLYIIPEPNLDDDKITRA